MISFMLNNEVMHVNDCAPDMTVLQFVRDRLHLTGTKEGCASGDCGACTVVLASKEADSDSLHYQAVNSCVTFMSALHGKQLLTVEHLQNNGQLHPVQQSLVTHHASQCGFCTPGFAMSMFALYHTQDNVDQQAVEKALSGNLCRCTGYRPIIEAALDSCRLPADDQFEQQASYTSSVLHDLTQNAPAHPDISLPADRAALRLAKLNYPGAYLCAGSTDIALQVTQKLETISHLISLSSVSELRQLEQQDHGLMIGAALPFSQFEQPLLKHFPQLHDLLLQFASLPIRNQATLGGNLVSASPIGDMAPPLLVLTASVQLDDGEKRRVVPLKEFFTDYRKTVMQPDEWLEKIFIPYLPEDTHFRVYKVSKRKEDDISTVCAAFSLTLDNNKVTSLACGLGGVAATPLYLDILTDALRGKNWTDVETLQLGQRILQQALSPLDDVRASQWYRLQVTANLLRRFWFETTQETIATRVLCHA